MLNPLPENVEPTRATLHAYAHAVGAIPRAHGIHHPRWWHISLKPTVHGLTTDPVRTPDGHVSIRMNFADHEIHLDRSGMTALVVPMDDGLTATEVGNQLIDAVGLDDRYDRDRFTNDDERPYDRDAAAALWSVFNATALIFRDHNDEIGGEQSPVQVWPHGFDMATEWFGTKMQEYEEHGEIQTLPAQLNLGFYPGGRAYFYSNPWPFDAAALLGNELPHGAEWNTEGWEGSILYLDQVAGHADSSDKIRQYARAVFDIASPTLLA